MKNFLKNNKILLTSIFAAVCVIVLVATLVFALAGNEANSGSDEILSSDISSAPGSSEPVSSEVSADASDESLSSEPEKEKFAPLVITSPTKTDITISESRYAITGTSDPKIPLLLNGKEVSRAETGDFSIDVELKGGANTFKFEYNGKKQTYTIRYNFTIIKSFAPSEKQSYEAGSTFVAVAVARVDCASVKATFNGKTITLSPKSYEEGEEFTEFTGSFDLPKGNEKNLNLGSVKFTATCNGLTRTYTSPSITCLRDKALDRSQIVEIVASQAETFNGNTTDDWSRPTNSYLPEGTLDYRVGGIVYDTESGNSYYKLRCGKRVYVTKKNAPDTNKVTVSKLYQGELPEYNTISLSSNTTETKHTYLTFDTDWKAPFEVTLAPQNYTNPSTQDYSISSATYTYVDIKFFYTKGIGGTVSFGNHPLFSSAKIIADDDGYILRLYLKKAGAFYGWNAYYNAEGQLEFKFLNPPKISAKNDLSGIKIVIDVGHGGRDVGAAGIRPETMPEAERNLSLAFKLKAELESYGATVIMNRTNDVAMTADARCEFLREQSPDYCIAIHHDSNYSSQANGGSYFYFDAFSQKAAKYVYNRSTNAGLYSKTKLGWHYFYTARVTSCPVVLTENGFMSNQKDFAGISSEEVNVKKAKALAAGILDYFNDYICEEPEISEPSQPVESVPSDTVEPNEPTEPDEPTVPSEPDGSGEPDDSSESTVPIEPPVSALPEETEEF